MAHEIFERRFISRGIPAWHKLGTVFAQDEDLQVEEAFRRAGLDLAIQKLPLYVETPGGDRFLVPDEMGLVRLATGESPAHYISTVHKDYPYLTNMEIAQLVGELSRASSWPLETAGALKGGELVFVTLKAGSHAVAGRDEVEDYYLFSDWRNGQAPAELGYVPRRVVCQNTLSWALAEATTRVRIPHTHKTFRADVEWTMQVLARLRGIRVDAWSRFDRLAEFRLDQLQRLQVWDITYPEPERPVQRELVLEAERAGHDVVDLVARFRDRLKDWESEREEQLRRRRDAEILFGQTTDEMAQVGLADTGWHAWQAITQAEDTRIGNGTTERGLQASARSAVFGVRAETKARAFQALETLAAGGELAQSRN